MVKAVKQPKIHETEHYRELNGSLNTTFNVKAKIV